MVKCTRKILTEKFPDLSKYKSMCDIPERLWINWGAEIFNDKGIKSTHDFWIYCIENIIKPFMGMNLEYMVKVDVKKEDTGNEVEYSNLSFIISDNIKTFHPKSFVLNCAIARTTIFNHINFLIGTYWGNSLKNYVISAFWEDMDHEYVSSLKKIKEELRGV